MSDIKKFLSDLLDFNFNELIVPRLITVFYILAIIIAGIQALVILVSGLSAGVLGFLGGIIAAPIFFLVSVIVSRISLEVILILFRISGDLRKIGIKQEAIQPSSTVKTAPEVQVVSQTPPPAQGEGDQQEEN